MGACSYLLVHDKQNDLFDVRAENLPCGTTGVTCTKSVTVRAYRKSFHMTDSMEVTVNGVTLSSQPATHIQGQLTLARVGMFISLRLELGLTVLWDTGE